VKDSVSKKKLAGFVNQKLKTLGYKPKKLRIRKRTFKQAQAKQDEVLAPHARRAFPELPSKKGAPKKPFPFQKSPEGMRSKTTEHALRAAERELEDLQKRREPENIEYFQFTKDVLMEMARKANIKGRSTMNKGQLITALRTQEELIKDLAEGKEAKTKDEKVQEAEEAVKVKKIKKEKKLESREEENIDKMLALEPQNMDEAVRYVSQLYNGIENSYPDKKVERLAPWKLRRLGKEGLFDYLDDLKDLLQKFINEDPVLLTASEKLKAKQEKRGDARRAIEDEEKLKEQQMNDGLKILEKSRNLNFDEAKNQKELFQIGRELTRLGDEYQKRTADFYPDVKQKLDFIAKEIGKETGEKVLETGLRLRVVKPAEVRPPEIVPKPQRPIKPKPAKAGQPPKKKTKEEELKDKLVREAERLEKIERDKKEEEAKKKAERDEKRRKAQEIGRQTREAERKAEEARVEALRLKEKAQLDAIKAIQSTIRANRVIGKVKEEEKNIALLRKYIEEKNISKNLKEELQKRINARRVATELKENERKAEEARLADEQELQEAAVQLAKLEAAEAKLQEERKQEESQRQDLIKKIYDLSKQTSTPLKNTNPLKKLSLKELGEIYNNTVLQQQQEMMAIPAKPPTIQIPTFPTRTPSQTVVVTPPPPKRFSPLPPAPAPVPILAPPTKPAPVKPEVKQAVAPTDPRDKIVDEIFRLEEILKPADKYTKNRLKSMSIKDLEKRLKFAQTAMKERQDEEARVEQQKIERARLREQEIEQTRISQMYDILHRQKKGRKSLEDLQALSDDKLKALHDKVNSEFNALPGSKRVQNQLNPKFTITKSRLPEPEPDIEEDVEDVAEPIGEDEGGNADETTGNPDRDAEISASVGNIGRAGQQPAPTKPPQKGTNSKKGRDEKLRSAEGEFGIDNHSIDNFLSKYGNEYLGCIAHDEIPSKIYPKIKPRSRGFFVINTDPSWKGGEHWQCVFFDARPTGSGSLEFYDSFADPIDKKLQEDLKGIAERLDAKTYLKLKENRIKQQDDNSDNCGYFCMNFITSRMRGKGFPEASGFDESVKGESDIHKFKKMNGFGFLPSFGSIASTLQRPLSATIQRVKNVGKTIGNVAQNIKEQIFFPEKKLPSSIQPLFEKYKNFKILSAQIRREPILAFVDKFINLISFGKFNEAKKNLGYDKMFHLSLILQLGSAPGGGENGPKLLIEKNERINMTTSWKDGNQVQYSPANGSLTIPGNPTLGEFYDKTLKAVGDHQFFTYNAFAQNCQAFIADLLRSNGALTPEAQNFVLQDAQTVAKQLPFFVSKVAQFTTDTAGRVRQFFGLGNKANKRLLRKQKYENFMRKIR
jgi:hypothetical protein